MTQDLISWVAHMRSDLRTLGQCQGTLTLAECQSTLTFVRNNVRELRKAKGWSQDQLGDEVGASRQTVISIEQGKYLPRLDLAFAIAKAFGKPVEEVFVEDGNDDM
jgi:putative transcriptional regulator